MSYSDKYSCIYRCAVAHAISEACMHAMKRWPAASELPLFAIVQCIGSVSYNSVNNTTSCMECVILVLPP